MLIEIKRWDTCKIIHALETDSLRAALMTRGPARTPYPRPVEAGMEEFIIDIDEANREIARLRKAVTLLGGRLEETKREATRFMQERNEYRRQADDLRACFPLCVGGGR